MRLALLALLVVVAGCDSSVAEERGSFALALSGARTATVEGEASFLMSSCRSLSFVDGETSLFLGSPCTQAADGSYTDRLRRGTFAVDAGGREGAFRVTFYDTATRRYFRGTTGTVEIAAESRERVSGRFEIETRPLDGDNGVDTTAVPLRITGTFDARGVVGLD